MTGFHRQRRRARGSRPATESGRTGQRGQDGVPTPADVPAKRRWSTVDGDGTDLEPMDAATMATADPDDPSAPDTLDEPPSGERDTERGLRGLVGSGSSQVTVSAAARARDAARPTEEDLRQAEQELTIVRRRWVPREPFRPGGQGTRR